MIEIAVSLRALLDEAVRRLDGSGLEQAGREARWIWEKVTGQSRTEQVTRGDVPVTDELSARYREAIDRRVRGEPLAHVLGEAPFRHLMLQSDRRALIPRPETEGLVDLVLERQPTGVAVDVGTGTGCIALSLAAEGGYDLVLAVERDPAALALARRNIESQASPVKLIHGDLLGSVGESSVDVVVSNPPYLTGEEYAELAPSVKHWEPGVALESGRDGMTATRRLIHDGLRAVRPGGWLVLEADCNRAGQVGAEAGLAGWTDVSVKADLFGRARYLVARRSE